MKFDLVIIGAGPTGLSIACALAKTKLKIAIIEKNSSSKFAKPQIDGRDIALTHRSKNILKKFGIWKFINSKKISPVKEARVLDGDSPRYLHFDHIKTVKDCLGYLVPNQIIRKAVYKKLQTLKKVKIFSKNEVSKIISNKFLSKVYLKNRKILESKLTVFADGRLSKNREKLGIYANKTNFGTSMTVFRMKHQLNNNNIASEYFHYTQTLAVLPIQRNLSSIVITLQNDKSKIFLNMTKEKINQKIENDLKRKFGKMSLIGKKYTYPMLTVYSNEFFRDRCVLVGDAAVSMHPITAQGFNLGLQGIDILQNEIKNALINKIDLGDTSVLKRYEKKFKKVSLPIYLATNGIAKLYTNQSFPTKIVRKTVLRLGNIIWPIKNAIMDELLIKNT